MNKGLKWHHAELNSTAASDRTHLWSKMQSCVGSSEAKQGSSLLLTLEM